MGLQELEGELRTETGLVTIDIRLVMPTRDEGHLAQLAELQLERLTWSGGVVAVRWAVLRLGRLEQAQGSLFGDDPQTNALRALNTLIDRLSSRLGAEAVLRVELLPDSQPEHVVRLGPWTNPDPRKSDRFTLTPEQSRGRPLRLLGRPEPIEVTSIVPDGPPIRMVWNRAGLPGGPRLGGRNGSRPAGGRAQDVERRLLPCRMGGRHSGMGLSRPRTGRWFFHGFFD